ncbi:helix-hairpin-helix domain-containing protein [Echinicola jeungdonensis]|uniref:ComEA family DNA-binding protein n=1 Tax=Echinicola jeungdonensis TaxID=709343 RepID=A0ABV5J6K7_9BACT|nr:helix-hairpin-helix domain-containing protein [Echinicola jeungdonensis]MDN3670065.1 helix-hairpin-helix domain-containing protein [Echinicola jeungdonensis]
MKKKSYILFFLFFLTHFQTLGQTLNADFDIEAFMEEMFSFQEGENEEMAQQYENLMQFYFTPLDLNKATADELQSLYSLSPFQIQQLLEYRNNFGPIISIYELQAIPKFDKATIQNILPFVSISSNKKIHPKPLVNRILEEKNAYIMFRARRYLETRKGYTPPDTLGNGRLTQRYLGDPNNYYLRFRSQHINDFSFGFTLDKDSGEQFIWDTSSKRYGFNFLSYHFSLYPDKHWKILTVGDYKAQFGQGLVFGAGFSVGKGSETITTTRRSSSGIRPYTSATEFGYFRGAAATYQFDQFEGSILLSHTPRSASILVPDSLSKSLSSYITSLSQSGYHRTSTEINKKSKAWENNLGANFNYHSINKNFQLGINTLWTRFSQPYKRKERVYNKFEFRGKINHIHSAYFSYNYQNHFFFGEAAISKSKGKGMVLGWMSSLSPEMDFSLLLRRFDRHFHTFYGSSFGENSRAINERGIYLGLNYSITKDLKWSGYFDFFRFPWLKFRTYAPSDGHEWLQRLSFSPKKSLQIYFQIREELKDRNIPIDQSDHLIYQLRGRKRRNYLANLDFKISDSYSIRSRVQWSNFDFNDNKTWGYALVQDINADWDNWRLSTRMAIFDTDDYDNRQYVYEKNVLWAFSIPAYYGQGMRYYFLLQYRPSRRWDFWIRWSRTIYTDRDKISSGLQEVQSNRLSQLNLQVRLRFNK